MNKIKQWVNPKEYLPTVNSLVLIKLGDYYYDFGRLWEINPNEDGEVYFLLERDGDDSIELSNIEAWCYIEIDNGTSFS